MLCHKAGDGFGNAQRQQQVLDLDNTLPLSKAAWRRDWLVSAPGFPTNLALKRIVLQGCTQDRDTNPD